MKNVEKRELVRLVKRRIELGSSMTATVNRLSSLGFKKPTIRTYYKTFRDVKNIEGGKQ